MQSSVKTSEAAVYRDHVQPMSSTSDRPSSASAVLQGHTSHQPRPPIYPPDRPIGLKAGTLAARQDSDEEDVSGARERYLRLQSMYNRVTGSVTGSSTRNSLRASEDDSDSDI